MPHSDKHNEEAQEERKGIALYADRKEVVFREKSSRIFRNKAEDTFRGLWREGRG